MVTTTERSRILAVDLAPQIHLAQQVLRHRLEDAENQAAREQLAAVWSEAFSQCR